MTALRTRLEQVNAELDRYDLCIKQLDNGRFAIHAINRKAALAGFDTYTRQRGSFDTLEAAYWSAKSFYATAKK